MISRRNSKACLCSLRTPSKASNGPTTDHKKAFTVYKRGSLKGRLTQKCFKDAVAKVDVDRVSANMGAIHALNKFEEITIEAMHSSNTEVLSENLLKATLRKFKKKYILELEESIRKAEEVSDV